MKFVPSFTGRAVLSLAAGVANYLSVANAQVQPGQVLIQAVHGSATYSSGEQSLPLKENLVLSKGAVLKTGNDATVDLILQYSGTVLRLLPNSTLSFDKIKGTEYIVRSDGAVGVISGSVQVIYNLPGNGGSIKVTVPAGSYFDPATGTVKSGSLASGTDINTVRNNAMVFKFGGATIVIKPQTTITPTKGGNNGVGNGIDPPPPGNPPINDGPGTGPGNPGNRGGHNGNPHHP